MRGSETCELDSGREHLAAMIPPDLGLGGAGRGVLRPSDDLRVGLCSLLSSLSVCETSYEGHMVDALASRADEGRRSLR